CLDPRGTADLNGDARGAEFVTRGRDEDIPCGTSCAPCVGWGWKTAPFRGVSSVCALISAFSAPYLPVKQELEALYYFKAKNGYNEVSNPPETHLGRNLILCSYLRINFHCFLGVVEQKLLPGCALAMFTWVSRIYLKIYGCIFLRDESSGKGTLRTL
uniref:Uncharacterized protein n=1 Tax=Aquila chrysaetos chrysaetos TaxID=223781 RepID=A0A663E3B6_AQUCH